MKTSRRELLEWLKSLNIQINKIEEIGQGTAICSLLSLIHPNVNFKYIRSPSSNYEYLKNLKIAQGFFQENSVDVRFPIEKLVLCKLQDNLEIAQWMYKYYVKHTKNHEVRQNEMNQHEEKILINNDKLNNNDKKSLLSFEEISKDVKDNISYDEDLREKNRQEIIDNLKKHYEESSLKSEDKYKQALNQNSFLAAELKEKEEEIRALKDKMGIFADNDAQKIIKDLEDNRDFYFLILVEVEKYLSECENIEAGIKEDLFNILYKK